MSFLDKNEPARRGRSRRSKREWKIAPAPGSAPVEGMHVLEEVGGALGLLLFQRLRDVQLWRELTDRQSLFGESGGTLPQWQVTKEPGEIADSISTLAQMVLRPAETRSRAVATACSRIAEWASDRGYGRTEAEFSRAAALVDYKNPELAFVAGRAARRLAQYATAEEWFMRAVGLARKANDEAAYATAFVGWGLLEEQRGRRDKARARFVSAWRAATRGKFRDLAAATRHNMIALSVPDRPFEEGQGHAAVALRLYRFRPEIARLAVDTAVFWSWHGYFSAALMLLESALPLIARLPDRLQVLANIARSAAATADSAKFHSAWTEIEDQANRGAELMPWVLIDLANGARALGYRRHAIQLASDAEQRARQRGEAGSLSAALALTSALQNGEDVGIDCDHDAPPDVLGFAARIIARLNNSSDR